MKRTLNTSIHVKCPGTVEDPAAVANSVMAAGLRVSGLAVVDGSGGWMLSGHCVHLGAPLLL